MLRFQFSDLDGIRSDDLFYNRPKRMETLKVSIHVANLKGTWYTMVTHLNTLWLQEESSSQRVTANLRCFSEVAVVGIQMEFPQSVSQLQLNQTFVRIDRLNGSGDETVTSGNGPD